MKNNVKIFITVIAIIIVCFAIILWDNVRIIEQYNEKAIQKSQELDGDNPTGFPYVRTVEAKKDKIIVTLYCANETVKLVRTFELSEGIVVNASTARHYQNKIGAKLNSENYIDKEVKGNIVYGKSDADVDMVGKLAETVLEEIERLYKHVELID